MEPLVEKIFTLAEAMYIKAAQFKAIDDASFREIDDIYDDIMKLRTAILKKDASDMDNHDYKAALSIKIMIDEKRRARENAENK